METQPLLPAPPVTANYTVYSEDPRIQKTLQREDAQQFLIQAQEMVETFLQKMTDYGNSYSKGKAGIPASRCVWVRLSDKVECIESLLKQGATLDSESLDDTLKDLSVYAQLMRICLKAERPIPDEEGLFDEATTD